MKKMFKAAASLAVGCALLSTSAFAALINPSVTESETAGVYTASVTKENATDWESTILVLKADSVEVVEGETKIKSSVNDEDIYYINQTSAKTATATYSIAQADEKLYVFAGGSGEDKALYLGAIEAPAQEPENDYITSADTDKATLATPIAVAHALKGISVNEVVITLSTEKYPNAGAETAAYTITVVDTTGAPVENAVVLYSTERKKYVALIPTTVADYKFEVTEGASNETFTYGDPSGDKAVKPIDSSQMKAFIKSGAALTTWKKIVAADVSGDGKVAAIDTSQVAAAIKRNMALNITKK